MAPSNLENNIRESLENRRIEPSPQAWEKLEALLDKKQPKRKAVFWYYMAASFMGILILGSVFFSSTNSNENKELVNENTEKVEKQFEILPETPSFEAVVSEKKEERSEAIKKSNKDGLKIIPIKEESIVDSEIAENEAFHEAPKNELKPSSEAEPLHNRENYLIEEKVDEVVASIKTMQKDNSQVTPAEVEILLVSANKKIQPQRMLQTPSIDAVSLLEEVEWELDKTFRDKVFDALGNGFQKLRVAIAERNY